MASGDLKIVSASLSTCEETSKVHLLPCELEYDGPAKVGGYFAPSIRQEASANVSESVGKGKALVVRNGPRRPRANKSITTHWHAGFPALFLM